MPQENPLLKTLEARQRRLEDRRGFFRMAAAAAIAAPVALTLGGRPLNAQSTVTDADILNFALNLEYLEAQFYVQAATGLGLPAALLDGTGNRGEATGGRQVVFTDPLVREYANEIAADEVAHVVFLRNALGNARVAQPQIDISPAGAFTTAANAAGLTTTAMPIFDPYLNDENFLLGAFIFEDVGVTAYKGAAALISNKGILEAGAGLLAVEAYHAALVRTVLFRKGIAVPSLIDATEKISTARDSLDGASDLDQGIRPIGTASNIAPLDANGLAFSRTTGQVLNIVYLNRMAVTAGGFFPNGVNGTIRTSAAN